MMLRTCRTCFQPFPLSRSISGRSRLIASWPRRRATADIRGFAHKVAVPPRKSLKVPSRANQAAKPPLRKAAAYESLSNKLATRASPTLLYTAPSHRPYLVGCYTIGIFLTSFAGINYHTQYLVAPEDLPSITRVSVSVGSFMLTCMGFWVLFRTRNLVRTISSLPSSPMASPRTLLLQIERTPAFPFRQPVIITVPTSHVTLSSHLFNNDSERRIEAAIKEIARREERLRAFAKTNLLTLPFRQALYWIWRGFIGVRRALTNEGFYKIHVKGYNSAWQLDSDPAWALDDGKALDKLVKIKIA